MTRAVGQISISRSGFDLEEMIVLAGMVKDWKEQEREEYNTSYRNESFREITRKTYSNSYFGSVPNTSNPPLKIRLTERESELYDLGTHFNEDKWYQITVLVDSYAISTAQYCLSTVETVDKKLNEDASRLKVLFQAAQIDFHSRYKGHCQQFNEEQETNEKNRQRAISRAKKILTKELETK